MTVLMALGVLAASVVLAALGSAIGGERWTRSISHRLVRKASLWRPATERADYQDEVLDLVYCYEEDGLRFSALALALNEYGRSWWNFELRRWANRRIRSMRIASLSVGLGTGVSAGLAYSIITELSLGLVAGACIGISSAIAIGACSYLLNQMPTTTSLALAVGTTLALVVMFAVGIYSGAYAGVIVGLSSGLGLIGSSTLLSTPQPLDPA